MVLCVNESVGEGGDVFVLLYLCCLAADVKVESKSSPGSVAAFMLMIDFKQAVLNVSFFRSDSMADRCKLRSSGSLPFVELVVLDMVWFLTGALSKTLIIVPRGASDQCDRGLSGSTQPSRTHLSFTSGRLCVVWSFNTCFESL